ncbi:dTDP-glucose 4,6-dehydratase [Streptomyces sp. NRRL S-455]|uniref:dTDP-glucose 4,6-dehydratase n=1 Tax=Streptomyces sp. NRRL S-455 TaxID=1463908 RepID=UPI0004BEE485|nr:NAD-dependent epimerase/dehydratase family protein [Streptomyces sp. NRRL S-455]
MRVLLTGASGFVGSHVLRHLLTHTDWEIVCPVSFHHKGLPARIASAVCDTDWSHRVDIVHWDMRSPADPLTLHQFGGCDVVMNVASESHVDRSISHPVPFVQNNVALMLNVLEVARAIEPRLFLQMSTDEVYGPAYGEHRHTEWEPAVPSNPYSASKAAQESIAVSYWRTYGVPVVLTNTMNVIGEMQDGEKFLPKIIKSLRAGRSIMVHTAPDGTPGSRFYLHARNLADAWLFLTRRYTEDEPDVTTLSGEHIRIAMGPAQYRDGAFTRPERYNIVGEREVDNIELVHLVGAAMGMDSAGVDDLIEPISFHASRPGHDLRYALDGARLASLGWKPPVPLEQSIETTVRWSLDNPLWLEL